MNKHKVGDPVTINAQYSTYDRMKGVITEIVDIIECPTVFPYTVLLDCGEENYFSAEELLE